jgi:hypothetical protein
VAKFVVDGAWLVLKLNWLEKFGDFSVRNVRVPIEAIETVEIVTDPHGRLLPDEVDFGFAGNTAPARKVMSLKTRAKTSSGGRAAVAEYFNRPAVVVRLAPNTTPWRLIVVSSGHAERTADIISKAAKV